MIKKIKVLHIIKTLSLGGAETNLLNLASAFDAGKVETHVAYSFGGEIEARFRAAGVRLFKYANQSYRVKSLHTLPIILRLAGYIRKHKVDIVQTHNFNGHIWGLIAAKLAGAKVIEHVHDHRYTPPKELARRHGLLDQYRFIKYFRKQSDRVIVLTREHFDYVVKQGFSAADRVLELQNGIPLDEETASLPLNVRQQFGIPPDSIVILSSARMEPAKNIDLILRVAEHVVKKAPQAVFLVAGNGTHLEEYKDRCRASNLQRDVRFIGFLQNMYDLLAVSDIFLLPSFLELHSIAILEALKMKLPVVVSEAVGCNDEFIESGKNGFLCDPFKDDPWIEALVQLLNNPDLRKTVGLKGYETCRRLFNIQDTAARFEKVYAGLIA